MQRRFQREIELLQEEDETVTFNKEEEADEPVPWSSVIKVQRKDRPTLYIPQRRFYRGRLTREAVYFPKKGRVRARRWYTDGQLYEEAWYRGHKLEGTCRVLNEEGVLTFKCRFHNDKRHGRYKLWTDEGWPLVDGVYVNGQLYGEYWEFCHMHGGTYPIKAWVIGEKLIWVSGNQSMMFYGGYCYRGTLLGWSFDMHQHLPTIHRLVIRSLFLTCHLPFLLTSLIAKFIPCAVMGPLC